MEEITLLQCDLYAVGEYYWRAVPTISHSSTLSIKLLEFCYSVKDNVCSKLWMLTDINSLVSKQVSRITSKDHNVLAIGYSDCACYQTIDAWEIQDTLMSDVARHHVL